MIAELLGGLLLVLRPGAGAGELLLAAGLLTAVLAVVAVLHALRIPAARTTAPAGPAVFAALRVLLRASDPAAAGHRRARAPGSTR